MVNLGFWENLNKPFDNVQGKPILCLAPMADVTDVAFRRIISKYSDISHVTYTEFVSADGLMLAPEVGRKKLLKDLEYSEDERPIVAQFFTSRPEIMEKVAELALELGFDGVDINMGCPDKSVEKQGAGAALIKNSKLAQELILAAKRGVSGKIPVSVKTRLGYNKDELEEFLPALLEAEPAVITIHARTRKEMSKVPARWARVKRAVEIRDYFMSQFREKSSSSKSPRVSSSVETDSARLFSEDFSPSNQSKTLIFGNGDVESIEDAYKKAEETGCDGVMLGRAIFGNPFLFASHEPTWEKRLEVLAEHTALFEEKLGDIKSFAVMKKHFKSYLSFVALAKEDLAWHQAVKNLREELMLAENASRAVRMVNDFLVKYN